MIAQDSNSSSLIPASSSSIFNRHEESPVGIGHPQDFPEWLPPDMRLSPLSFCHLLPSQSLAVLFPQTLPVMDSDWSSLPGLAHGFAILIPPFLSNLIATNLLLMKGSFLSVGFLRITALLALQHSSPFRQFTSIFEKMLPSWFLYKYFVFVVVLCLNLSKLLFPS